MLVGFWKGKVVGLCLRTAAVQSHAACPIEVVLGETDFLYGLLGEHVTSCEEYGGCDCLGEERLTGELGLVPGEWSC